MDSKSLVDYYLVGEKEDGIHLSFDLNLIRVFLDKDTMVQYESVTVKYLLFDMYPLSIPYHE